MVIKRLGGVFITFNQEISMFDTNLLHHQFLNNVTVEVCFILEHTFKFEMCRRKNLCRQNQAIKLVMNFATCCNRNESNWRFDIVDFDDSNIPKQKSTSSTKYCLVVHVSIISIPKQYFKNLIFHQNSYCGRFLTAMLSPKIRTNQISVIFSLM